MTTQDLLQNEDYRKLLQGLGDCIIPRITTTHINHGQYREAVFYQIEHGTGHLSRVRKNMEIILRHALFPPTSPPKLSEMDIFVALATASFHDLGMHFGWNLLAPQIQEPPSEEQQKIIRERHGLIGALWFRKIMSDEPPIDLQQKISPYLLNILKDNLLNELISFVIEAHQMSPEEIEDKLPKSFLQEPERKRGRFLACLLKFADVLDMDCRRVSRNRMEKAANYLMGKSSIIKSSIVDIIRFMMICTAPGFLDTSYS